MYNKKVVRAGRRSRSFRRSIRKPLRSNPVVADEEESKINLSYDMLASEGREVDTVETTSQVSETNDDTLKERTSEESEYFESNSEDSDDSYGDSDSDGDGDGDGDDDDDSDSIDYTCNEDIENAIRVDLINSNLIAHARSQKSNKSDTNIKSILKRAVGFLGWFAKQNMSRKTATFELIKDFLKNYYECLPDYYVYLSEILRLKPSTVVNYNEDLLFFFTWFVMFREGRRESCYIKIPTLFAFNLLVKSMRKVYTKLRKVERSNAANSIEELIKARKWPKHGLAQLYKAVADEKRDWLRVLISSGCTICKSTYNMFMQLLGSSAYVSSPQGRIGAIENLTLNDVLTLILTDEESVLSDAFKTRASFGYQPVTGSPIFLELLRVYLKYFRYVMLFHLLILIIV